MADTDIAEPDKAKKSLKFPLLLGVALAIAGAGGSFYLVRSGLFIQAESSGEDLPGRRTDTVGATPDVVFVAIEPVIVALGNVRDSRHLRFRAQLEVNAPHRAEVEQLLPRVVDVLNTYLRALDISDLEDQAALVRLRSQMLRRIQMVTGAERVRDLLIMEFVLN